MPTDTVSAGLLIAFLVALLYALYLRLSMSVKVERRVSEERSEMEERVERERQDALDKSRAVLKGKVGEQLAPFTPQFPFDASDARFVGSPVDYVVFDGYTLVKDGDGADLELYLVDIKTGDGKLTREQREIRSAVEEGRVEWRTVRL